MPIITMLFCPINANNLLLLSPFATAIQNAIPEKANSTYVNSYETIICINNSNTLSLKNKLPLNTPQLLQSMGMPVLTIYYLCSLKANNLYNKNGLK